MRIKFQNILKKIVNTKNQVINLIKYFFEKNF